MQIQYNYLTLSALLEIRSLYYVHTFVHSFVFAAVAAHNRWL